MVDPLIDNIKRIREEIKQAAAESGREMSEIRIVPATKTVSPERINLLYDHGIDTIGENRVQELLEKYDSLDKRFHIHFIGKLQTNKVKYIIDKVDMIQSLDSMNLCKEISKRAVAAGKVMEVLVEVNIGYEESKSGIYSSPTMADPPDNGSEGIANAETVSAAARRIKKALRRKHRLM